MGRYPYRNLYTWNANLAYVAGLIASDGCLYNDGRHIAITSKDIEIIQNVKNIIATGAKPSIVTSEFGSMAYRLQLGNVGLYDFLLGAGITSAKSKTIKFVAVPDIYYTDFLRGVLEGDGTTYGYMDPIWPNCHRYYVAFASGSREFLVWLKMTNQRQGLSSLGGISACPRVFRLLYGKADSRTLFASMYYSDGIPKLNRKYVKLKDFISSDPYAKITHNARVAKLVHAPTSGVGELNARGGSSPLSRTNMI